VFVWRTGVRFHYRCRCAIAAARVIGEAARSLREGPEADMKLDIRNRMLTVVLLGALTSALSLVALWRVLSITTAQRLERARDVAQEEIDRLVSGSGENPGATLVGMRAGELNAAAPPGEWRHAVEAARGKGALVEERVGNSTLVVVTRDLGGGRVVWAGYLVAPPAWLRTWQIIVSMLAVATAALVFVSIVVARRLALSRAEEERLSRELTQKERLAALGRVAAGVAHEVRNPLASIKLRLDLAAAGAQLPSEVEGALVNASSEIARLDRLVSDLLMVAGRPLGPRKPSSLGELAQSRAQVLAPWAAQKGVEISVEGDARASVDPDSVARAFDNLLRNAVEASPPGGHVTARVEKSEGAARVVVEDGGPGVAEERAAELFEPFFTTKPEGTGLGLAITRAIARAHGGELTYARAQTVTRFELSVPA
jgi:signal transduction histidine kinase